MIEVNVFSLAGCADTPATIELVQNIAKEMGLEISLAHIIISSTEEAIEHKFPGSPTVRINGKDIEASMTENLRFGLT